MASEHKKVQKRIQSVQRFQDITKAIRFVTGGEFGEVRQDLKKRYTALSSFIPLFSKKYGSKNVEVTEEKNIMVISLCDDRTACGMHNRNVMHQTASVVDGLIESGAQISLYTIGLQAKYYCDKFYRRHLVGNTSGVTDVSFSIDICSFFVKKFLTYIVQEYVLIFNRFISLDQQYTVAYKIPSFNIFSSQLLNNVFSKYGIYYNSILEKASFDKFLEDIYLFSFSLFMLDAFNENHYSFLGARFTAMDQMIQNSQEFLEKLKLKYHKLRQESITNELIEIVVGANCVMEREIV